MTPSVQPGRIAFTAEQRRRRRQGAVLGGLCALAIALAGLPLSTLLTPAVFTAAAGLARLVPAGAIGGSSRRLLLEFASTLPRALALASRHGHPVVAAWRTLAAAAAVALLPGFLSALGLWVAVRAAFLRGGTGGVLLALRAHAPAPDELGELRLRDVVEEMAVAAGVPAPRVMVLDHGAPNAGVVGSGAGDVTLLFTRAFVDEAPRDELQGVAAHLIGSAGNGDLRLALTLLASFATLGLVSAAFDAVTNLSRSAAADVLRAGRWIVLRRSRAGDAERIAELLERDLDAPREDGLTALLQDLRARPARTRLGRLMKAVPPLQALVLPVFLVWLPVTLARIPVLLIRQLVAAPLVTLAWRSRRYLADATAVELTRNPDGLAAALERLGAQATSVPGGEWADYLFIVTERGGGRREGGDRGLAGGAGDPHPTVERRVRRLRAMGARGGGVPSPPRPRPRPIVWVVLAGFGGLLGSLLAAALGLALLLGGGIPLVFTMAAVAIVARVLL